MTTATHRTTTLAYDDTGTGTPVVFLHGLTFDRRTWSPIVERLGPSVRCIVVDLPAHGESGGAPAPLDLIANQIHDLVVSLAIERPVVVGHSLAGGIAFAYSSAYPTAGVAVVDNGPDVRPYAELLNRLEPVLRSPAFADAWQQFEASLGLDLIPEPVRSLVLETHVVRQEVVVGYWETLMRVDAEELQATIDAQIPRLDIPWLAVFGRPLTDGERERFAWLRDVQLEEWVGDGHFVHLVDPNRFASTLLSFIDHCKAATT